MARWFKGAEGGKQPPGAAVLIAAMKLHQMPETIENMDCYWWNRLQIWMDMEAAADKLK